MRRLRLLALFACLIVGLAAAPGASPAGRSWAQPEIRLVVSHGLMARTVASFRPNDALTQGELSVLVAELTEQPPRTPADPAASVTMAQLDARLVRALDMADDASSFQDAAAAAGLRPPTRFGTEVVARLLGLRTNHPTGHDDLEQLPNEPATRAETAYSVAGLLTLSDWQKQEVDDAATSVRASTADSVAAQGPDDRRQVHRLPLHLGRRVRDPPVAVRRPGPGWIRLLRVRLARLQGPVLSRCPAACGRSSRPYRRGDGRRGSEAHDASSLRVSPPPT